MAYNISDENLLFSPLLEQLPGWMFIKDIELKYTSTTLRSALLCGFKKQHDKYGKSDYELKCKAAESAAFFQEEDNKVISSGKEMSFLQLNQYADNQTHVFLTKKIPVKNLSGKIIGVCGMVEEISNSLIAQTICKLANMGKVDYSNNVSKKNFQINVNDIFNQLSERESELVFYFIRGLTSKEIGLLMHLSPQIVKSDLEIIQNKFNCNSKNNFLDYCITHGFLNVFPQSILERYLKPSMISSDLNKKLNKNFSLIDHSKLSKRQKECLDYLIEGFSTKEIAAKLHLSPRTIEYYINIMMNKFHCRSRYELIKKLSYYFI